MARSRSKSRGRATPRKLSPARSNAASSSPRGGNTRSARGKSPSRPSSDGAIAARRLAREDIENLKLWSRPVDTLYYFSIVLGKFIASPIHAALNPKNMHITGAILASFILLLVARATKGPHSDPLERIEHQFWYTLWWFGLGVASSVGLGTGAHTGTLFLFPHICAVVRTAENRKKLDFDFTKDSWDFVPKLVSSSVHCAEN